MFITIYKQQKIKIIMVRVLCKMNSNLQIIEWDLLILCVSGSQVVLIVGSGFCWLTCLLRYQALLELRGQHKMCSSGRSSGSSAVRHLLQSSDKEFKQSLRILYGCGVANMLTQVCVTHPHAVHHVWQRHGCFTLRNCKMQEKERKHKFKLRI